VGQERAIVTDVPGTTRDHIDVPISIAGVPILLTDTAGLRESGDRVEAIGIARARSLVEEADVLVWLGEDQAAPEHPRLIAVRPKADLPANRTAVGPALPVSSITGAGVATLIERITVAAKTFLPAEDAIALNRRQAHHINEAAHALDDAAHSDDLVLIAENLRSARSAFDRLTGRAGVEDVLDALFSRFCLGK
jgi:tRNA modification GTPase